MIYQSTLLPNDIKFRNMCKSHLNSSAKQLTLILPSQILSDTSLTSNEKIVIGFDFSLFRKRGYNSYRNNQISKQLNLHVNSISNCRIALVRKGFLNKSGRNYQLTERSIEILQRNNQIIHLPYEIYSIAKLGSGEKLLWGLYNSVSRGLHDYFAKRETTARNLGVSEKSITTYTQKLYQNGLLKLYKHNYGYCSSQTVIVTCDFINGEINNYLNRVKDHNGRWIKQISFPGDDN